MRVLIIGGTGFIGSYVLRRLIGEGHSVAVFHRGQSGSDLPRGALRVIGDRRRLADYGGEFERFGAQVVLDMIPYVEGDALALMATFCGKVERVVIISSQDVYRAYGLFLRLEEGSLSRRPTTKRRHCAPGFIRIGKRRRARKTWLTITTRFRLSAS